ncbi:polysaccharide deacetylase family protein [Cohnella fermenti]|uniref:Polysaccharide deacetylase family protein n=1 Tax=Cohnella fermenti TaxID=2565925 RepID=A0A4S4C887_9BACL|nr:polysaccharide deacetylase family protein [Cohnella fermenti]THF84147.1 polysaccharide deacetylase family protein [Cohnella fermenti]
MKTRWRRLLLPIALLLLAASAGCGPFGGGDSGNEDLPTAGASAEIVKYEGEPSRAIPFVYTTAEEVALTFNGLSDADTMRELLDELDRYKIQATFFIPGMRAAEEPDLVNEIASRGHEIENNTLSRSDMTRLSYEQTYKEIHLANRVIEEQTGIAPKYLRTKSGDYTDDVRLAAAQEGMEAVVVYSLFLHNWQEESEQEKYLYLRKYMTRGGVVAIDTEEFKAVVDVIPLIAKAAEDVGYRLVRLDELVGQGGERKPLEQIPGYDAVQMNENYKDARYRMIDKADTGGKKVVALTFDDWGTDYTINRILRILDQYRVKATFFVRAKGVEGNPNLARAILEKGHDVANHSYSHPVVTSLTAEELQQDLVKAHQVITEAIQEQPTMLFRPPTGEVDDYTAKVIAAVGLPDIALYDVTALDWDSSNSAEDIVNSVMKQTGPGSVILLHMLDDIHTLEALPVILERLQEQGYTFDTMSHMIGLEP